MPWKSLKYVWIWSTEVLPNLVQEIIPYFDIDWPPRKSICQQPIILHAEKAPCGILYCNGLASRHPTTQVTMNSIITDIKRYEFLILPLNYINKYISRWYIHTWIALNEMLILMYSSQSICMETAYCMNKSFSILKIIIQCFKCCMCKSEWFSS